MKRTTYNLLMPVISMMAFVFGIYVLWGEWKLLLGLFFLTYSNNISQGLYKDK